MRSYLTIAGKVGSCLRHFRIFFFKARDANHGVSLVSSPAQSPSQVIPASSWNGPDILCQWFVARADEEVSVFRLVQDPAV